MGTQKIWRYQRRNTHQVQTGTCEQSNVGKGGRTEVGHGGRIRHAAWVIETSDGIWRLYGGGKVLVDDVPRCERVWESGNIKRSVRKNLILLMGGR